MRGGFSEQEQRLAYDGVSRLRDHIQELIDNIQTNCNRVKTGFPLLDTLTNGLRPGSMCILAARPAVGKTAFALNLMMNVAKTIPDKKPVVFFSCEMSESEILNRVYSQMLKMSVHDIENGVGGNDTWFRLVTEIKGIADCNMCFLDRPGYSARDICRESRKIAKLFGGVGLIIIDYLQLLASDPERRFDNRTVEVSISSRTLKLLAGELNCPVIVLSQLSRDVERRSDRTPNNADLRDSGAIEQDADLILMLSRNVVNNAKSAVLTITKNRHGGTGKIYLDFDGTSCSFTESTRNGQAGSSSYGIAPPPFTSNQV